MNISQPVASYVGSVNFGILSSEEIRRVSAKWIQNPETFDTLLHPTPGGLYDTALGAWGDYTCSTCDLKTFACPGHPGHIELPLPIYHVTYMDQIHKLLQSQCAFCLQFRITKVVANRFRCKLQLLQYGLVAELQAVDRLEDGNDEDHVSSDEATKNVIGLQDRYVKKAIAKAGLRRGTRWMMKIKTEAVLEARRAVLYELFSELPRPTKCKRCSGRPYRWRKDKANKFFRDNKGVIGKNAKNSLNHYAVNPLKLDLQDKAANSREKKVDREVDEGIDVEFDEPSEEEAVDVVDAETSALDVSASDSIEKDAEESGHLPNEYVNPKEVLSFLEHLFRKERDLLNLVYNIDYSAKKKTPDITPDIFFIKTLLVPPNRYRPEARTGTGQITEAQQNTLYKRILTSCVTLYQLQQELRGEVKSAYRQRDINDFNSTWVALQDNVNALFDSERNTAPRGANREPEEGIKQRLEKKEGLFRMNMMGKRVNFAARSVISPDPNIETHEIGVPPVFAKKLTFPEPVFSHNGDRLRAAVLNGPNKHPGAAAIENENGQVISLLNKSASERQALANALNSPSSTSAPGSKNKKVHRHLVNGDFVIMNRQPTLHKPSMMCHRARVLPGERTIRMHYANCNTYNADFDGDEMNMHFPQSQIAKAEAETIADTNHQYLVATSGKPLRGLIQDHLSMGVWLTNRDTLFDRGDYQQLLYSSLRPEDKHTNTDKIQTVDPAICKPKFMWTGKQIITTVLKNLRPSDRVGLTLTGRSQTPAELWSHESEERDVIFKDGEFLCGILDKAHLGPANGGFVHAIYEAHGNEIAGKLLSVMGRLLTKFLHMRAWSCGMEDIVLAQAGDLARNEVLKAADTIGLEVAAKYVSLAQISGSDDPELRARLADVLGDKEKHAGLDSVYGTRSAVLSTDVTNACLPDGLWKPFPRNQMQTMTQSGAKGSMVNANQISCNLGQQTLEGRRVPVMVSGKTLPSFKPFETDIRAGGYIVNRFLTGVQPQSYYFHAMAGREGLIDTAVKTARSGYLQRCIIKGMEGLRVEYDSSVRDSDGSVVQFLYGEDALDVTKQTHLTNFKFLAENFMSIVANVRMAEVMDKLRIESVSKQSKETLKKVRKNDQRIDDPVISQYNPGSRMGSVSEAFLRALEEYIKKNPDGLIRRKKDDVLGIRERHFRNLLELKYLNSVAEPGEAMGIVAGQSIGEPSTQMTLNTFHLAGHAAKNVTLGIPRLREIVMTASANIMTPTMTLCILPDVDEMGAQTFAKGLSKLSLAEIVESVQVRETIRSSEIYNRARAYQITLNFYPQEELMQEYAITAEDVAKTIEQRFMPKLKKILDGDIQAKLKAAMIQNDAAQPKVGVATSRTESAAADGEEDVENAEGAEKVDRARAEVDSEDENDPDDDATQSRMKNKTVDNYDDSEIEEDARSQNSEEPAQAAVDPVDEGYVGSPRPDDTGSPPPDAGKTASAFEDQMLTKCPYLSSFTFDLNKGSRCEFAMEYDISSPKVIVLNHVEALCRLSLIQNIPGVGAATLSDEKIYDPRTRETSKVKVVITEGINLVQMREYQDEIDPHMILTNDISAMLKHYGVEAARDTIVREVGGVFAGHSIQVDTRHLNLLADMMTRHGGFSPFNRYGMQSSTSPFMQMSFETTVGFLKDAVLSSESDHLMNPSARLVAGRTSGVGTGAFDVLLQVAGEDAVRQESPVVEVDEL